MIYKISKEFNVAMGHRLSCHNGLCKNFHGHNYKIIVGVKSKYLNENGMVMDFSDLKIIVNQYLDSLDHALMINEADTELVDRLKDALPELKVIHVPYEPTAENMAAEIYHYVKNKLEKFVQMDYVTIYETESSKATYTEE
jgi:6-pyruvoyltetrahydropterin/6-carboxytetrahydropterin synthase